MTITSCHNAQITGLIDMDVVGPDFNEMYTPSVSSVASGADTLIHTVIFSWSQWKVTNIDGY